MYYILDLLSYRCGETTLPKPTTLDDSRNYRSIISFTLTHDKCERLMRRNKNKLLRSEIMSMRILMFEPIYVHITMYMRITIYIYVTYFRIVYEGLSANDEHDSCFMSRFVTKLT